MLTNTTFMALVHPNFLDKSVSNISFRVYIFFGSRKRFSQKEAERWWEENQTKVHHKYEIETR